MLKKVNLSTKYFNSKKIGREKNIALIGLGPHAKRIYLNYFKKHNINLSLVVDLKSKTTEVNCYLKEQGFNSTKFFFIDDKFKDIEHLTESFEINLLNTCKKLKIDRKSVV